MKSENAIDGRTSTGKLSTPLILLFAGLFIVASAGAAYLYIDNNTLTDSTIKQKQEIEILDEERINLQDELVNVEASFNEKIKENEALSTSLEDRLKDVEALKWRLNEAKKKLKSSELENSEIVNRLGQLELVKSQLERDIASLAVTNTELKLANEKISEELENTNEYAATLNDHLVEMSEKNSDLIQHLYTIAPAGFIADNFVVKAEKRNDKLTSKAKLADEVLVSFDLNNVPELYHGEEEIYLVLAKFDGQPVASVPTKSVNITSTDPFMIKAADVEKLSLNNKQQVDMSVHTDKDLEAGTYNLLVYADHGFLGATSFQLR